MNSTVLPPVTAQPQGAIETREEFGAVVRTSKAETASEVLAAQAAALVQARFVMALRQPRDWDVIRQRLLKDCERPSFAAVARYAKPIGTKKVTGLSVAFARAALRHMTNTTTDAMVVYDDAATRTVRITTTDLESNTTFSKDVHIAKTVERKQVRQGQAVISTRFNSYGDRVFLVEATEDDLLTKEAAHTAKVLRQNALAILPGDIQAECEDAILSTLRNESARDPEAEKKKLIDAFDDLGIRVADLKLYLDVADLGSLSPKDLTDLRAIYQAVREGETNWREVMEQREAVRGTGKKEPGAGTRSGQMAEALKERAAASPANGKPSAPSEAPSVTADAPEASAAQEKAAAVEQPSGAELFPKPPATEEPKAKSKK